MPPRWKTAVVIWLAIYPALTFLLWLAGPKIAGWPLPLRTLVLTAVLVPLMVFLLLPAAQRLLAPWLRPRRLSERGTGTDEALATQSPPRSRAPEG